MDMVEKAGSLCQKYYMHGKLGDVDTPISSPIPRLPVDSKLHYDTMARSIKGHPGQPSGGRS